MYMSGSSEESRGLEIYILFIYISYSNKILWDSWRKYARTNTRLRPASEIKIFVIILEAAAELFLHLEVFVCRIFVTVDLHICNVSFLGRGCLIDLDEALRRKREAPVITLRQLSINVSISVLLQRIILLRLHAFSFGIYIKVSHTIPRNDYWLMIA